MDINISRAENGFITSYWKETGDFEGKQVQHVFASYEEMFDYVRKAFENDNGKK